MAKPDEALALLRNGLDPVQIAVKLEIAVSSTCDYLDRKTGAGQLRRSDIYFSIAAESRRSPPSSNYAFVVKRYKDAASAYGDMYDDLRRLETRLHKIIRDRLTETYGTHDSLWWHSGVPEQVRVKCEERHRDGKRNREPYVYTDLLDLLSIIEANWLYFKSRLPGHFGEDPKRLKRSLQKLNGIRNRIMHPVRDTEPTEDEFEFVRTLSRDLGSV
jgi:hypothetical protein